MTSFTNPVWPVGASITHGCGANIIVTTDDVSSGAVTISEDGNACSGTCPGCALPFEILKEIPRDPA
jgi:hypothetical protein